MNFEEQVEVVYGWFERSSIADKKIFKNTEKEKLCRFHFTLGMQIRNYFKLWDVKWEPEIRDGVDYSPNHPDAVSTRIIEAVWEKVQDIHV